MSFAQRFPKVAALLGANANEDEQRRDEGDEADDAGDGDSGQDQGGQDGTGDTGGGDAGGGNADGDDSGGQDGGDGGAEATASLAALAADDRAALREAFTRDANAQVAAERARCIAAFTSDAGRRSPNAAARLLQKTAMSSKDVIDTLGDMGATSRGQGRDRLNGSAETRVDTGQAPAEQSTARDAVLAKRKETREKRNAAALKKGGVRANRTEFDDRDSVAE